MKGVRLLIFLGWTWSAMAQKQPNVLFILSDDHTAQAWGIYGGVLSDFVKNENIKALAEDGVVLDNMFCTNSICVPSRASILTGQYSHRNGVYLLSDALEPSVKTVAHAMQEGGYETALVGKWHLKKEPAGFDYYMVLPGQGRYHNPILKTVENWQDGDRGGVEYQGYVDDVITEQSIKWLKERDSDQPFFLCTQFKATHEPFGYPERHRDFLAEVTLPFPEGIHEDLNESGKVHPGWPLEILGGRFEQFAGGRYPGGPFSLEGLEQRAAREKTYQKFVKDFLRAGAAIDDQIGKLISYLKAEGLYENTIIIYTSDQGYFLGEHGFFDKRFIYEPSLRMPTVIKTADAGLKASRVNDMLLNIDFAPTILSLVGLTIPASMQGQSFDRLLTLGSKSSQSYKKREAIYYRYWTNSDQRPAHYGIRTQRYKLVNFYGLGGEHWELYDLELDPDEGNNIYALYEQENWVAELKRKLMMEQDRVGDDL
jgi:arylsulfatase A-like enzyme